MRKSVSRQPEPVQEVLICDSTDMLDARHISLTRRLGSSLERRQTQEVVTGSLGRVAGASFDQMKSLRSSI